MTTYIDFTTIKTGDRLLVPLTNYARQILTKYEGTIPKAISSVKMNKYLKELGQVCGIDGVQRLLNQADWESKKAMTALRAYVLEQLGSTEGVLIVDETGFLKKGQQSAGVKRQYSGTAGRVENCQVGVFLTYATASGAAFIDQRLYLPKEWLEDRQRCKLAGIPKKTAFATKPELAR